MSSVLLWKGGNGVFNTNTNWHLVFPGDQDPSPFAPGSIDFAIITGTAGQVISGGGTTGYLEVLATTSFDGAYILTGDAADAPNSTSFQIKSNATATFGAGDSLTVNKENAQIGLETSGVLILNSGADMRVTVASAIYSMQIGGISTINGNVVSLSGAGTTFTGNAGISAGFKADGTLQVTNGALVTLGGLNNFGFTIGENSATHGTFNLNTGADLTSTSFAKIGNLAGSFGSAVIDGVGTSWHQGQGLYTGYSGTGFLTVRNQAHVDAASVVAGALAGSHGTIEVRDAGSILSASTLVLGGINAVGGAGSLAVKLGGLVNVGNELRLFGPGNLSVATGGKIDVGTPHVGAAGALTIEANGLVKGAGTINAPVVNKGIIEATNFNVPALADKTLTINGAISGTGIIKIKGNATLEINGAVAATQTVLFDDTLAGSQTLRIKPVNAAGFAATIGSIDAGDRIDLLNAKLGASVVHNTIANTLTVKNFFGAVIATLKVTNFNDASHFIAVSDGAGGTLVKIDNAANAAPVITSNGGGTVANVNAIEEHLLGANLTATDVNNHPIAWQIIGGADAAKFVIGNGLAELSKALNFKVAPNFEGVHGDANHDNIYDVIVAAADGHGGFDTQTLHIKVVNAPNPLNGTAGDDTLVGTSEGELINGLAGGDVLKGLAGNDVLNGRRI